MDGWMDGWMGGWQHSILSCRSEHLLTPLLSALRGGVLSSGPRSNCPAGVWISQASPPAPSASGWWSGLLTSQALEGCSQRGVPAAASCPLHPPRRETPAPVASQTSRFLLQEPSPQVRLAWDFKPFTFYPASLSRAWTLWPHGLGQLPNLPRPQFPHLQNSDGGGGRREKYLPHPGIFERAQIWLLHLA